MDIKKIEEAIEEINKSIEKLNKEGYIVSAIGNYGGCTYVSKIYIRKGQE